MDLYLIKRLCEKKRIAIKELAENAGMSEQNLHRCVRENKIQAQDLERIAHCLNVSILSFFQEQMGQVIVDGDGNQLNFPGASGNVNGTDVEALKKRIQDLENRLADKDEIISLLKESRQTKP